MKENKFNYREITRKGIVLKRLLESEDWKVVTEVLDKIREKANKAKDTAPDQNAYNKANGVIDCLNQIDSKFKYYISHGSYYRSVNDSQEAGENE